MIDRLTSDLDQTSRVGPVPELTRSPVRRRFGVVLAVVLSVLAIGVLTWMLRSDPARVADTPPVPTTQGAPGVPSTDILPAEGSTVSWNEAPDVVPGPCGAPCDLQGLAHGPGGFLAVALDIDQGIRMQASFDGVTWLVVDNVPDAEMRRISLTTDGERWVLSGMSNEGAARSWVSDDGRQWTELTLPSGLVTFESPHWIASPQGLVAYPAEAALGGRQPFAAWVLDGTDLIERPVEGVTTFGEISTSNLSDVVFSSAGPFPPMISTDGLSWTEVPLGAEGSERSMPVAQWWADGTWYVWVGGPGDVSVLRLDLPSGQWVPDSPEYVGPFSVPAASLAVSGLQVLWTDDGSHQYETWAKVLDGPWSRESIPPSLFAAIAVIDSQPVGVYLASG